MKACAGARLSKKPISSRSDAARNKNRKQEQS
jgi:hypothetical protein